MVLFSCQFEASWLKSFVRAYEPFSMEFYWLFTDKHVEGSIFDAPRYRFMQFRLFPLEYYARDIPSRRWIFGSVDHLSKAIKRFKPRENVRLEVRDDGALWVDGVQVGNTMDETDVPSEVLKPITPKITEDGYLKVVVKDFKRFFDGAKGLGKSEDLAVGFNIKGREGAVVFYDRYRWKEEKKFSRLDIKPYEPWLLDIGGSVSTVYKYDLLNESLVLGISDIVKITIMQMAPCKLSYNGDFFDIDIYQANVDEESLKEFQTMLEMKPPARTLLFVFPLHGEDMKAFREVVRAIDSVFRGAQVWFGITPYDFYLYWSYFDRGYLKISRAKFEEFISARSVSASFGLSDLASWLRDVEKFECWLENEPPTSMVLIGKGEKIAPKELRSEELQMKIEVPEVYPADIFRGTREILADVFIDAVTAEEDFLVFISTPHEIKVFGRDVIYYRASLPLNGFKTVEEDFIPISERFLKGLKDFFTLIPAYTVSLGRVKFDVYIGTEINFGELRVLLAQTADEAERAVIAYREETKRPVPPAPEEAKPLPAPPPPPPAAPPEKLEIVKVVEDAIKELEVL